jgi:hypothetical protein
VSDDHTAAASNGRPARWRTASLSLGWRRLAPGSGRLAARVARPIVAGALACGTVLAMTAPAFGQPPSWSVVPSPNAGPFRSLNSLYSVSCMLAATCTAAGSYHSSGSPESTLIESSSKRRPLRRACHGQRPDGRAPGRDLRIL